MTESRLTVQVVSAGAAQSVVQQVEESPVHVGRLAAAVVPQQVVEAAQRVIAIAAGGEIGRLQRLARVGIHELEAAFLERGRQGTARTAEGDSRRHAHQHAPQESPARGTKGHGLLVSKHSNHR